MAVVITRTGGRRRWRSVPATFLLLDSLSAPESSGAGRTVLCALPLTLTGPGTFMTQVIDRDDATTWRAFLERVNAEADAPNLLLVVCPHSSATKAAQAVYPGVPTQISATRLLQMLASRIRGGRHRACLTEARRIFTAQNREAAMARFIQWRSRWIKHDVALVRLVEADLASALALYRFPKSLRRKIRTANSIRRMFKKAYGTDNGSPPLQVASTAAPMGRDEPPAAEAAGEEGMTVRSSAEDFPEDPPFSQDGGSSKASRPTSRTWSTSATMGRSGPGLPETVPSARGAPGWHWR